MPTVAEVKAAADKLPVAARVELLEHLAQDKAVARKQLARLRAAVEEGDRDLAEGRYTEVRSAAELRKLFDDIRHRGQARQKRSA